MSYVRVYIKYIETDALIPGGNDVYNADRTQSVEELKNDIASYYNLGIVTSAWTLKTSTGRLMDDYQTVGFYGLANDSTLYLQDPALVKLSYSENNGPTVAVWVRRTDTITAIKQRQFPGQQANYTFSLNGRQLTDASNVASFVSPASDNIYLDLIFNAQGG